MPVIMHFYTGELKKICVPQGSILSFFIFYLHKWLIKNYSWKI